MGAVLSAHMTHMLFNDQALCALASEAEDLEKSRSAYWEEEAKAFTVTADGKLTGSTVLGSVSTKMSPLHTFAHWALQWPFRLMGFRYKTFAECERLGRLVAKRQGRQFTNDMIRQVLSLALIRHYVDLDGGKDGNLVIGDGFGVLTSLFLLAAPNRVTILINLTKPLILDLAYARKAVPDLRFALATTPEEMKEALSAPDVQLIAVQADNASIVAGAPIGVAANIVSMQEMNPPVVAEYFRILRSSTAQEVSFYCCNKLQKTLNDGAVSSFLEYPWEPADRILHESVCPWSQWYYNKKPPFWFYRRGKHRVIWHRMALLAKEGA